MTVRMISGNHSMAWFPDGNSIVIATKIEESLSTQRLELVSLDTGNLRAITDPPDDWQDTQPRVSRDGQTLAFVRTKGQHRAAEVYTQRITGTGNTPRLVLRDPAMVDIGWSADGAKLLYSTSSTGGSLMSISLTGGNPVSLLAAANAGAFSVDPTGRRLVYERVNNFNDIWRVPGPASQLSQPPQRMALSSTRVDARPSYSPDGSRVAFVTYRSGRSEVWICRSDGTSCGPVPNAPPSSSQDRPSWSPDGRHLTFEGVPTGEDQSDIHVVDLAAGAGRVLVASPADERNPIWSHDGRHLYFTTLKADEAEVSMVPVEGGGAVPIHLTKGRQFPVAEHDGFLYLVEIILPGSGDPEAAAWRLSLSERKKERLLDRVWGRYAIWNGKIVYVYADRETDISRRWLAIFDPATKSTKTLIELGFNALQPTVSPDGQWVLYQRVELARDLMLVDNLR